MKNTPILTIKLSSKGYALYDAVTTRVLHGLLRIRAKFVTDEDALVSHFAMLKAIKAQLLSRPTNEDVVKSWFALSMLWCPSSHCYYMRSRYPEMLSAVSHVQMHMVQSVGGELEAMRHSEVRTQSIVPKVQDYVCATLLPSLERLCEQIPHELRHKVEGKVESYRRWRFENKPKKKQTIIAVVPADSEADITIEV